MEHVFPTCTMPRVDFHALANQNLNEFWKKPANRHRSRPVFRVFFLKLRVFSTIPLFRKSLMEKTRILNDNHAELRQKRNEPRLRLAVVSDGE